MPWRLLFFGLFASLDAERPERIVVGVLFSFVLSVPGSGAFLALLRLGTFPLLIPNFFPPSTAQLAGQCPFGIGDLAIVAGPH